MIWAGIIVIELIDTYRAHDGVKITFTTRMDHAVDLFCSRYTTNRIEGVKEVYVCSE